MLKQNGMVMLTETELETIIQKKVKEQTKEIETRNKLLRKALMQVINKNKNGIKDVRIAKVDFLEIYHKAVEDMLDNPDEEDNDIYGYDITVHWHGLYCNCGDGAIPCNYIIPAIENCLEEDNEEYIEF